MFDLMNLDFEVPIKLPLLDITVGDIQVEVRPSEIFPLPEIHIEANLDIRIGL